MNKSVSKLISKLSEVNIALWHEEDKARLPDTETVTKAKRNIDKYRQNTFLVDFIL